MSVDILSYFCGKVSAYCYMITTGCKSCASINIENKFVYQIKSYAEFMYPDIKVYIEDDIYSDKHKEIYFYKNPEILFMIKNIPNKFGIEKHVYQGCLYSYGVNEIAKFISKYNEEGE